MIQPSRIATLVLAASLALGGTAGAVPSAPDLAAQADALWRENNLEAARPLYEQLATADPRDARVAERLAYCLLVQAEGLPTGKDRDAAFTRTRIAAERARGLGAPSDLLRVVLDRLNDSRAIAENRRDPRLNAAEQAFSRGDLDAALAAYTAIAAEDPASYEARVYAGDVYFRRHDYPHAGEWFAKAIQVDPDRESAYRYWGDALVSAGDPGAALAKYVEAVVAEPYRRESWLALAQWAKHVRAELHPPRISPPPAPTEKAGSPPAAKPAVVINANPQDTAAGGGTPAWLAYSLSRARWHSEKFLQVHPGEAYRHSLAEEAESLKAAAQVVRELKIPAGKVDESLGDLLRLDAAGFVEAYVLLNAADAGIARDYPDYRREHRDRLRQYVTDVLVHAGTPP